jgi:hypothetical protein
MFMLLQSMLIGVLLDLRGFVSGIYSRKAYERVRDVTCVRESGWGVDTHCMCR